MKKIALVFLLTFVSKIGFSQKNADLINILSQIRQTQLYQECQKFKNTVETQTYELRNKITDENKIIELEQHYNDTWQKYDTFLKTIKEDIVDGKKLENLTSDARANQYLLLLEDAKKEYNSSIFLLYQSNANGKDIPEEVLQIGINLIKQLIAKIKSNKAEKREAINSILPKINEYFYNNLKLKTWSEFDSKIQNTVESADKKYKVTIPTATLSGSIEGTIEFIRLDNGNETTMEFQKNEGKNIVIDEDTKEAYRTPYFVSNSNYPDGTKYKIIARMLKVNDIISLF